MRERTYQYGPVIRVVASLEKRGGGLLGGPLLTKTTRDGRREDEADNDRHEGAPRGHFHIIYTNISPQCAFISPENESQRSPKVSSPCP
jgi:hypothetical protein